MQSVNGGNPRSVIPRTRTSHRQFVFGGVAFEVLADKTLAWQLPAGYERHTAEAGSAPAIADVICSVSVERALPPIAALPSVDPCFRAADDRTAIFSPQVRADLSRVAPSRYAAAARVTPGADGIAALLLGVASAVVHCEGGVSLRAEVIALAEQAVLFLGPPGAGKTTAANLCAQAHVFAKRRVHLVVQGERVMAFSLPGEGASALPDATQPCLPVASVLRVRQGNGEPKLVNLDDAAKIAAVRDAVEISDLSTNAEDARLRRIARLCHGIPVCELHTVLAKPLTSLIRSCLPTA